MKRIVLYTMAKCPHCQTAKDYLDSKRIKYRLCNVQTPKGQKELAGLGLRSVPALKVGDQILNGFSIKRFEQVLKS